MAIFATSFTREGTRITLHYEFDDGLVKTLVTRGDNDTVAAEYLVRHQPSVESNRLAADIDSAIQADSDAARGEATQVQVYKAWMFKGYLAEDPIEAYRYLSKVAEKVIALGLTVAQLAAAFGEDVDTVQLVLAKWQYLNSNKTAIQAYIIIKENM